MKISHTDLRKIIQEEMNRALSEAEVIDFPGEPSLPWEFGPQGYLARPELRQKMSDLEYGSDSPPELILSIALSNRAEEMIGYKKTVDPAPFKDLAMRLYKDYIVGMAGNVEQNLHDITSRIDAGDYFDEDIIDVIGYDHDFIENVANRYLPDPMYDDPEDKVQMAKTQDLASQQDPDEVEEMGMDFERFLQGIESGDVVELEQEED